MQGSEVGDLLRARHERRSSTHPLVAPGPETTLAPLVMRRETVTFTPLLPPSPSPRDRRYPRATIANRCRGPIRLRASPPAAWGQRVSSAAERAQQSGPSSARPSWRLLAERRAAGRPIISCSCHHLAPAGRAARYGRHDVGAGGYRGLLACGQARLLLRHWASPAWTGRAGEPFERLRRAAGRLALPAFDPCCQGAPRPPRPNGRPL